MPDPQHIEVIKEAAAPAAMFAGMGLFISLGQMLLCKERLTVRIVLGRAISTMGLAMCAGASLAVFPGLPLIAQLGLAALLASLGTSGLEIMVQRVFGAAKR